MGLRLQKRTRNEDLYPSHGLGLGFSSLHTYLGSSCCFRKDNTVLHRGPQLLPNHGIVRKTVRFYGTLGKCEASRGCGHGNQLPQELK